MIEGLILMVIALAITISTPAARQIGAIKHHRHPVADSLDRAYPLPAPPAPPTLEFLVIQAEAALERDRIARKAAADTSGPHDRA